MGYRRSVGSELLAAVGQVAPDGYDGLPGIPVALAEWMSLEANITDEINAGGLEFVLLGGDEAPLDRWYVWEGDL